jgi:hypothetical protein
MAATPSFANLRPLRLGELLDEAIRLYRRNFLSFIGIVALIQIPLTTLQLLVSLLIANLNLSYTTTYPTYQPESSLDNLLLASAGLNLLLAVVGYILVQIIAAAALTRAVADNYLGQRTGVLQAYRSLGWTWLKLIGAFLVFLLIGLAIGLWSMAPCIGNLTGMGMSIFWWTVVAALVAPCVVLETHSVAGAVRRAWELARQRFWWLLGFMAILYLFLQLTIAGPRFLLQFALYAIVGYQVDAVTVNIAFTIINALVALAANLLLLPLQKTATILAYFDLRVRSEGFDLTILANSLNGEPTDVAALVAQAAAPPRQNLITANEIGYFAIISIALIVLMVVGWWGLAGLGFLLSI